MHTPTHSFEGNAESPTGAKRSPVGVASAPEWAMLRAAAADAVSLAARLGHASHRFHGCLVRAHRLDGLRPHAAAGVAVEVACERSGQVVARAAGTVLVRVRP
jgi:hypothetical protein